MASSSIFHFTLLLLAVSPVVAQTSNICNDYYNKHHSFPEYSYLYLKFEEALIKDHKQLEEIRTTFMSSSAVVSLNIHANMSAVNVANSTCDYIGRDQTPDTLTFCPAGPHNWGLCYYCSLDMTLVQKEFSSLKLAATEMSIFQIITYVFLIYSNYLPVYWPTSTDIVLFDEEKIFLPHRNGENIKLKIDSLTCNPSCDLTQCVLSWVRWGGAPFGGFPPPKGGCSGAPDHSSRWTGR